MLANFFNSELINNDYDISFSYVYSIPYSMGFQKRVHKKTTVHPLSFINLSDHTILPSWLPLISRKLLMGIARLVISIPLLTYQTIVLYQLFKKIKPDVLHINNGGYPAAKSARAAAIAGKFASIPKIIMVVNNMAVGYNHYSRWFDYPIDRLVVHSVSMFITGSKAASERLRKVLSLPIQQTHAIHNGITLRDSTSTITETRKRLNLDRFDGVVFGVVALLIPRKGHQILLNAVLELIQEKKMIGNTFKVLIEGDGFLRETLISFVTQNKLEQFVTFVGEEANVVDFMNAIDILILPSIQDEDFPNVILEAMALGKPVIASRLAGTPEQVIDGVTGFLVAPRDAKQLAEAMHTLILNQQLREQMGKMASTEFSTHFTTQIALNNYSDLYTKLIKESQ
ncbi:glycosyltransferase family 4 protein [Thiothrix litoralis]|uniref:Glycosyltransferase family 4 protein n=1 Tax=Thiothrix litoralis TaxID=2891210 RepID=A0ABX7WS77_9GAMM|nr:glycosyltransferase family 4 protein [Thiothrix litoralis]QTR46430.1 glycosyltransferase family 4 protein [Thiothrix litoralis]